MECIINPQLCGEDILKLCGADILNIFIENGLHTRNLKVNWLKDVVCVCRMTFLNWRKALLISKNTGSFHAEYRITRYLRENIQWIRCVEIFCSYSPCSKLGCECCYLIGRINEDLETQKRRRGDADGRRSLTFVFSQLYNIARPSCMNGGCFERVLNRHTRPQENAESLNNLRSLGDGIRSFEMGDWQELIWLLACWDNYGRSGVPTGEQILFLEWFLYGEYGRWRRLEDENLKRDFQELIASNSHIGAGHGAPGLTFNTDHRGSASGCPGPNTYRRRTAPCSIWD